MKRVCEFAKADDFIFPLTRNICEWRGIPLESVTDLFTAVCEGCGSALNGQALVMSASMIVTVGHPKVDACPKCGSKRFIGTVVGISPVEEQMLLDNEFFRKLENPEEPSVKKRLRRFFKL